MKTTPTALPILAAAAVLPAEVKPNALFSGQMVLQSRMAVPLWGAVTPVLRDDVAAVAAMGQSGSGVRLPAPERGTQRRYR
jgi:hypothetical protein